MNAAFLGGNSSGAAGTATGANASGIREESAGSGDGGSAGHPAEWLEQHSDGGRGGGGEEGAGLEADGTLEDEGGARAIGRREQKVRPEEFPVLDCVDLVDEFLLDVLTSREVPKAGMRKREVPYAQVRDAGRRPSQGDW